MIFILIQMQENFTFFRYKLIPIPDFLQKLVFFRHYFTDPDPGLTSGWDLEPGKLYRSGLTTL